MTIEVTADVIDLARRAARFVCRRRFHLVDHVFGEVMRDLWERYDAARGCTMRTFANRAARWALADAVRAERRHEAGLVALEKVAADLADGPDVLLETFETEQAAFREIVRLSDADFDVVVSSYVDREPMCLIAERLGLVTSSVSRRRRRILMRVQQEVSA